MTDESDVACSFCGVGKDEARLIAGLDVFICEECVELCVEVIRGSEDKKATIKDNPCKVDSDALGPVIGKWVLKSTTVEDGKDLVNHIFGSRPFDIPPDVQLNELKNKSQKNIQEGQGHLSRGVVTGFRNPIMHGPIDTNVPAVFSELDCLNILSLVSYLLTRLDGAKVNVKV